MSTITSGKKEEIVADCKKIATRISLSGNELHLGIGRLDVMTTATKEVAPGEFEYYRINENDHTVVEDISTMIENEYAGITGVQVLAYFKALLDDLWAE